MLEVLIVVGAPIVGTLLFIYVDPIIRKIFMSEKDRIMYDDTFETSKFEKLKKRVDRWLMYVIITSLTVYLTFLPH